MYNENVYYIALSMIPEIGCIQIKNLLEKFETPENIFKLKRKELNYIEGIGEVRIKQILTASKYLKAAEEEYKFIEKNNIQSVGLMSKEYPSKLKNCIDAPTILYFKGNTTLNFSKMVSIVGTRSPTEYGKILVENLLNELKELDDICIISGLAYGIDGLVHKKSVQLGIPTIGVVAHGINILYPPQHVPLAKSMLTKGGILTEFRKNAPPDKHNFPKRNRIVAGMADVTIIIETAIKGGSMITASLANNYNRDVFAFPGKITDTKSEGCLQLIEKNLAGILLNGKHLIEQMGWLQKKVVKKKQLELFIQLNENEKKIINILNDKRMMHIDELMFETKLTYSQLASCILNLEIQYILKSMPGKMIELC